MWPQIDEYEVELRARFLRATLIAAAAITLVYLLQGAVGFFQPRYYPWDGLLGLALALICAALYRQEQPGRISLAASWVVAAVNVLAAFYSQAYGVQHPVTAVYLIGIVLAGLLVGGWFLPLWSALGGLFVLLWAMFELNGTTNHVVNPIRATAVFWQVVLFWWMLFGVTSWLVWLFAHNLERAVQISRAQTTALTHTLNALASEAAGEMVLDSFLRRALTAIAGQLGAQCATLFFHDLASDQIVLRLAYDNGQILTLEQMRLNAPRPTPASELPIWQTLRRTRTPLLVDDINNDLRLKNRALMLSPGIGMALYVPLLLGERAVGFFGINSLERRSVPPDEIALAQALAHQVTLAMQFTRLVEQQGEMAVIAERNRIAREIHDTLAQGFTGILIQLEAMEDALDAEPAATRAHIARARALARASLSEARRSVWALRPQALDTQDLTTALHDMAQRLTAGSGVTAQVTVTGDARPLPAGIAAELLRIGQEAVNNALKHSGASAIAIELAFAPERLTLTVGDNGCGFDATAPRGGFGLTSMRERAEQVGGRLTINSQRDAGTRVMCQVGVD
ncbi:MAG: GAF domain-containing protein [Anaerolinea sp.]|nr:GAF domain-containing protein [Anaerolinea sp.]